MKGLYEKKGSALKKDKTKNCVEEKHVSSLEYHYWDNMILAIFVLKTDIEMNSRCLHYGTSIKENKVGILGYVHME